MKFKRLGEVDLRGKRVFIRADLNVPCEGGRITDDTRIRASVPAIRAALDQGAAVMVTSHLGRPKEGAFDPAESLAPIARRLSELLEKDVPLVRDWLGGVQVAPGDVVLLENCRFNVGEKKDDEDLARKIAALCDVYVNDAFGAAHRAEATTHGVARFAKVACAGPLMAAELDALTRSLSNPPRPLVAVVGGAKVSTKLTVLAEPGLVEQARRIAAAAHVPLPEDVVVAVEASARARSAIKAPKDVQADEMILDIGPRTAAAFGERLKAAGTIVWNGPVGLFEVDAFAKGTHAIGRAIAESPAFSIAGGGETVAAIHKFGLEGGIDYISTAGGAFLEFLEGKKLPAVAALEARADS